MAANCDCIAGRSTIKADVANGELVPETVVIKHNFSIGVEMSAINLELIEKELMAAAAELAAANEGVEDKVGFYIEYTSSMYSIE